MTIGGKIDAKDEPFGYRFVFDSVRYWINIVFRRLFLFRYRHVDFDENLSLNSCDFNVKFRIKIPSKALQ